MIGPSGTGKSTFLSLLNQLEKADGGEILFKGESILHPGTDLSRLRRQVGMVFQSFFLFSHLTIVENIMLAQVELLGRSKEEAFRRSMEMLEMTGLADKALNYPNELSGGQQQRAAIARELGVSVLLDHYQDITDAEITFEYQENTGEMYMKTVFEGTDFDPLRQGDPVCTSLIRNAARDISYTCAEGKGIVKGRLSRSIHI